MLVNYKNLLEQFEFLDINIENCKLNVKLIGCCSNHGIRTKLIDGRIIILK